MFFIPRLSVAQSLAHARSEQECAALIIDFARQNNVSVLAFDKHEMLLPFASSPFLAMMESGTVTDSGGVLSGIDGDTFTFRIRREITEDQPTAVNTVMISEDIHGDNSMLLVGHVGTPVVVGHCLYRSQSSISGAFQPHIECCALYSRAWRN